jgi:hypothetical protein
MFIRSSRMFRLCMAVVLATAIALTMASSASAGPSAGVIFDSIPEPLPGNVASLGFEATSTSEFGDYATFDTTNQNRVLQSVDVVLSSWGCESGTWHGGDCSTSPGATFSHPITFTIYANAGAAVRNVIATATQTFDIPFRPSADPDCTGGRWEASAGQCFNGLATVITFDFSGEAVILPDSVIYGVAYNTTHYGASPIGESADCYTQPAGCGYDSLNVGSASDSPTEGTDDDEDATFLDSTSAGAYCDGGIGGTGTLRLDTETGCWTGFNPNVRFNATSSLGDCAVVTDATTKTLTLLSDCTTDETIQVPNGWTFDGDEHTITGVDPSGNHFRGAVVQGQAGPGDVTIEHVTVTVSGLANVCDGGDGRLRGILFDGVGGVIRDNEVFGIKQGASGCQEGNAIEVRNEPFTDEGIDRSVTVAGNTVEDYHKTGIIANGSVAASIRDNVVTGAGPINYIAQNGIQVGFGGTAIVRLNSVSGNDYMPLDTVACGLLMFEADGVKQSSNVFFENEKNVCNFGRGGGSFKPSV